MQYVVEVRLPVEFFATVLEQLPDDGLLSLEGHLKQSESILRRYAATTMEVGLLRRNTLQPMLDFYVLSIHDVGFAALVTLLNSVGLRKNVAHIHIEQQGRIVLSACDGLDNVGVGTLSADFLTSLQDRHIIRSFREYQ